MEEDQAAAAQVAAADQEEVLAGELVDQEDLVVEWEDHTAECAVDVIITIMDITIWVVECIAHFGVDLGL